MGLDLGGSCADAPIHMEHLATKATNLVIKKQLKAAISSLKRPPLPRIEENPDEEGGTDESTIRGYNDGGDFGAQLPYIARGIPDGELHTGFSTAVRENRKGRAVQESASSVGEFATTWEFSVELDRPTGL